MKTKSEKIILSVENLNVSFGGEKILEDINFNVTEGENIIIMGPNGSGKTILLKSLLGLIPFTGKIAWGNGIKIGYVPQKFSSGKKFPLNIEEFFSFKKINKERAISALKSVGVSEDILKKTVGEISTGQTQRILIAWALSDNPNVLLFDEPTAGIDIGGEETVYNLLSKLEKERDLTILFVTHDVSLTHKLADSVICLNKKMLCHGTPKEVFSSENIHKLYGDSFIYEHNHDEHHHD